MRRRANATLVDRRSGPTPAQILGMWVKLLQNRAQIWATSGGPAALARIGPDLARKRLNLFLCPQSSVNSGRNWPTLGRLRTDSGRHWANFDHQRSDLAGMGIGQIWAEVGPTSSTMDQVWPEWDRPNLGRRWPNLRRTCPNFGKLRVAATQLGACEPQPMLCCLRAGTRDSSVEARVGPCASFRGQAQPPCPPSHGVRRLHGSRRLTCLWVPATMCAPATHQLQRPNAPAFPCDASPHICSEVLGGFGKLHSLFRIELASCLGDIWCHRHSVARRISL